MSGHSLVFGLWIVGVLAANPWWGRRGPWRAAAAPDRRGVRSLLILGAVDMVVRLVMIATKLCAILALGRYAIVMDAVFAFLIAQTLGMFVGRLSRGNAPKRGLEAFGRPNFWGRWAMVASLMSFLSRNGEGREHLTWLVGVYGLALLGAWLDREQARGLAQGTTARAG